MAVSRTGAVAVSRDVPGEVHGGCLAGAMDVHIGVAIGGPVAGAVRGISRAVCSVAEGTGKTRMRVEVTAGDIREGGAVWPAVRALATPWQEPQLLPGPALV